MYTNTVFNKIKETISDKEVLNEIHDTFHPYHGKSISNLYTSGAIVNVSASAPLPERLASLPTEEDTFEAIVKIYNRPALLVQNNSFEDPVSETWKQRLIPYRSKLEAAIRATGRIEIENHPYSQWLGTGWMVRPDIMITNRHVAEEFAYRNGQSFKFKTNHNGEKIDAFLDFKEEYQNDADKEIKVTDVLWIAHSNEPDMAVLKVDGKYEHLELKDNTDDGAYLAVIGYPAFDSRNGIQPMNRIFNNIYDVKRLQPGMRMFADTSLTFRHDCSTLGGNSGSPVVDIESGKVAGLHFAGRYRKANYAVEGRFIIDKLNQLLN